MHADWGQWWKKSFNGEEIGRTRRRQDVPESPPIPKKKIHLEGNRWRTTTGIRRKRAGRLWRRKRVREPCRVVRTPRLVVLDQVVLRWHTAQLQVEASDSFLDIVYVCLGVTTAGGRARVKMHLLKLSRTMWHCILAFRVRDKIWRSHLFLKPHFPFSQAETRHSLESYFCVSRSVFQLHMTCQHWCGAVPAVSYIHSPSWMKAIGHPCCFSSLLHGIRHPVDDIHHGKGERKHGPGVDVNGVGVDGLTNALGATLLLFLLAPPHLSGSPTGLGFLWDSLPGDLAAGTLCTVMAVGNDHPLVHTGDRQGEQNHGLFAVLHNGLQGHKQTFVSIVWIWTIDNASKWKHCSWSRRPWLELRPIRFIYFFSNWLWFCCCCFNCHYSKEHLPFWRIDVETAQCRKICWISCIF